MYNFEKHQMDISIRLRHILSWIADIETQAERSCVCTFIVGVACSIVAAMAGHGKTAIALLAIVVVVGLTMLVSVYSTCASIRRYLKKMVKNTC